MSLSLDDISWGPDREEDRKTTVIDGIRVSIPRDYVRPHPVFCPVCLRPMRSSEDISAFDSNECCAFCDIHFYRSNKESWRNGWRPTREEVESLIADKHLDILQKTLPSK